jgi:hypothetical protein
MAAERKAAPNEQAAEERAGGGSRRQLSRESRHLAARRLAGVSPLHRSRLAHFAVELCGAIDDKRGAKRRPGRVLITSAGFPGLVSFPRRRESAQATGLIKLSHTRSGGFTIKRHVLDRTRSGKQLPSSPLTRTRDEPS